MTPGRARPSRLSRLVPVAVAVVAGFPAFLVALRVVQGLRWPHDQDLYRDIAQAQVFADGAFADPFYAGEHVWYNPLVPALFAALGGLFHLPLATVATQSGPWLGLLAVAAFFVVARRLFDPWTAALATVHLVLLRDPDRPGWTSAGLTPWAFTSSVAQVFAWLLVLAARAAWLRPTLRRAVLLGAAAGLAFLAHTAAALVPVVAVALAALLHAGHLRRRLPTVLGAGAVALLVAAPFLASIVGHYGLQVVNAAPLAWTWEPRDSLPENALLRATRLLVLLPALLALARLLRVARRRFDAALGVGLLTAPLALLALPAVVPAFHFVAYAEAAVSLLAGHGLVLVAARLQASRAWATLGVVSVVCLVAWPTLPRRMDVLWGRPRALELQERDAWQRMRAVLRDRTEPRDVVLASDELALFVVAPAGRAVLVVEPVFSNPYVDHAARAAVRDGLWAELRARRPEVFAATAARHHVRFVLASRIERPWTRGAEAVLEAVAETGGLTLYRVIGVS